MSEQAVVTHADAQAARNPPEKQGDEEGFPGEEEESGNGAEMEQSHKRGGDPIDFVVARVGFAEVVDGHGNGISFRFIHIHTFPAAIRMRAE